MLQTFLEFDPKVTMREIKYPAINRKNDIPGGRDVPHAKAETQNLLKHSEDNMGFDFAGVLQEPPCTAGADFWQTRRVRHTFQGFAIKGQETPEQRSGH